MGAGVRIFAGTVDGESEAADSVVLLGDAERCPRSLELGGGPTRDSLLGLSSVPSSNSVHPQLRAFRHVVEGAGTKADHGLRG